MKFRVVISDRDDLSTPIAEYQHLISSLNWSWNRIGGCGAFDFEVPIKLYRDPDLGLAYNVKIYLKESASWVLRYQGKIQRKRYSVRGKNQSVRISGFGYQAQLNKVDVDRNFSSTEISSAVTSILNGDVVPNTDITFSAGDIVNTGFTADSLEFNTDAIEAFGTLADTAGSREWGVDENRSFYFKARSETVGFSIPLGKDILDFEDEVSEQDVVNSIIIIGGQVSGSPFTRTVVDTKSQIDWGLRKERRQNSSIITNAVADQYGESILSELKRPVHRVSLKRLSTDIYENTVPIPLVNVITTGDTYNTRDYAEGLYNDLIDFQVNRINYNIDSSGNMTSSIQLGKLPLGIAEAIGQIESKIKNLQAVGV